MYSKLKLISFLIFSLTILCESRLKFLENYKPIKNTSTRKYHINLEDDLYTQLKPILDDKSDSFKNLITQIMKNVPEQILLLLKEKTSEIKTNQDKEWLDLINITANITEIDYEEVLLSNILYEVMCTSIVIDSGITDEATGVDEIFMGRNLDFDFTSIMEDLAYEGYYYLNNELQYIAQGIAGYVSPVNGVKIGKFAISMNERFTGKDPITGIERLAQGDITPSLLLFKVLKQSQSYTESFETLSSTHISTPAYYIISGIQKNEGAILTRSHDKVDELDVLDVDNGKWYLVQTNSDRNTPIDHDIRRYAAETRLNDLESNRVSLTHEVLMNEVMTLEPNKNNYTAFSTIQSPFNGGYLDSIYY